MIGGLIHNALSSGGGGSVKPIIITKNGEYDAAYDEDSVIGYNPVNVEVTPVIKSLTVRCNGTYRAPEGVDGYNPVIVNSMYETLYKLEHGITDEIDTGVTDDDGNEIIVDGVPLPNGITDVNGLITTGRSGNLQFTAVGNGHALSVTCLCERTSTSIRLGLTVTDLITGATASNVMSSPYDFSGGSIWKEPAISVDGSTIRFGATVGRPGSWVGTDVGVNVNLAGEFDIWNMGWGTIYGNTADIL